MEARKSKDNLVDQGDKHGNSPGSVKPQSLLMSTAYLCQAKGKTATKPQIIIRENRKRMTSK